MTWVIIDSGLKGLGGHNFTYTDIVREGLRNRGIHPIVLANKAVSDQVPSGAGFRAVFSRGAYDFGASGTWSSTTTWKKWGGVFERELGASFPVNVTGVFSHTLAAFELDGWTRFARRLPPNAALVLLFRSTPGYLEMPWWKRTLHPYFRHQPACLRSLRSSLGSRVRVVTDSEELSVDLRSVYDGSVETFPIPVDPLVRKATRTGTPWSSGALTRGYLGDARAAKGFDQLPAVAEALLPSSDIRLLLQCVSPAEPSPIFDQTRALLSARKDVGVQLVEKALSREDYAELVAAMDIVIVPYTAPGYRRSTSGIFAEALATGKPVIVPSETWMSAELARGEGAGVTYPRSQAAGLADACREAIQRYPELAERARERAAAFAERHSPAALVEQLLAGVRA